jgi:S1-C subfamily serine protease
VGSGVVISPDGLIITAAHVVFRAEHITVTTPEDARHTAVVVGLSEMDDLALIKIEATGLTPIDQTDARVAPGRVVLAVGHPPGIGFVVSHGIVNVLGRSTRNFSGDLVDGLIQTTAAVEPGVSGGALVDGHGRLAGIVISAPGSTRAISFAVPAGKVRAMVTVLMPAAAGITPPFDHSGTAE